MSVEVSPQENGESHLKLIQIAHTLSMTNIVVLLSKIAEPVVKREVWIDDASPFLSETVQLSRFITLSGFKSAVLTLIFFC